MNNVSDTRQDAKLSVVAPAKDRKALEALAVLEQMYGYFSFDPMPMEMDLRLAA